MHVVMATVGTAGDVLPLVSVARRLRERGNRVTVLANPYFRDVVTDAALGLVPLGRREDYLAAVRDPDRWHPRRALAVAARRAVLPALRPTYDYLAGLDPRDTVVAGTTLALGARLAQERLGFRLVGLHLEPALLPAAPDGGLLSGLQEWRRTRVEHRVTDPLLAPPLNALRAQVGLGPVTGVVSHWAPAPGPNLALFPDWFAERDRPGGLTHTGFVGDRSEDALPLAVQEALADGERPVVVQLSTVLPHGRRVLKAAVRAARGRGRRVLVLSADRLPPALPSGVVHAGAAPLDRLLPQAAAFVHHGDTATVARALAAGVPQVLVPVAGAQPHNADRLVELGVARQIPAGAVTAESVGRALDRLAGNAQVAQRAAAVARRTDLAAGADAAAAAIADAAR